MDYKIIVDDVVLYDELWVLLDEMKKGDDIIPAEDLFHYNWRTKVQDEKMLENSVFITARDNKGKLVGVIRVVTDKAYIFYIADGMVIPEWRGKGVGSALIEHTLAYCKKNGFMKIFLGLVPYNVKFYKKFGFKESMCGHYEIKFGEEKKYL